MSQGIPSPPAFGTLRRNWHVLAAVLPGVALTMLDAASLDLPRNDITQALNSDKYRIQWIFSAYLIGSASGMCLTGFLSGRLGLRWSYLLGLATFTVPAGLCALVSEVVWMTPLRYVQGFGTGLTVSAAMVLLLRSFPDRRALAMALYGMGIYLAALAGPTLGGLLTYEHSWRWIFGLDLPLGLCLVALAWLWLTPDRPKTPSLQPFDFVGFFLALLFLIPLHVALNMGQYWGWFISPFFAPWMVMFTVFFGAFIVWGIWWARPLFNLRMFSSRNFALGLGIKVIFSINLYAVLSLLSPYMIELRGYQWWQGGLVFGPAVLALFAVLVADVGWGTRFNRKLRMFVGLAAMAFVTWRLSALDVYTSKYWLAAWLALWGAGAGLVIVPAMMTIFEDLSVEQTAHVAGLFNITRTQPAFVAASLLAALWVQTSDNNFDRLRLNITHNRPIVKEATRAPMRHFNDRGSSKTVSGEQARAFLTQWVHANSKAWAFGTVLRYLAVVTGTGLVLVIFVRRGNEE